MTQVREFESLRPVPRWVRIWAVITATVAISLLFVLGGFVTSFRVGMADPIWPTEPWYLLGQNWRSLEFGFLVEHTHRAAGWIVGLLVTVLALGAWSATPSRGLRWFGLAAMLLLLMQYGEFHRGMMAVEAARQQGTPAAMIPVPMTSGVGSLLGAFLVLLAAGIGVVEGRFGCWTRALAAVTLIAVMIQGLLGGFRVYLNELLGPELAAVHGAFGQVVFTLFVTVAILAAPRSDGDCLAEDERRRLRLWSIALPVSVFVQLVWAVWLRHLGSPLAQRLHILTAFVVTGLAVVLINQILSRSSTRQPLGFLAYHLLGLIALQLLLGVESWMEKFAAAGPHASVPPELRPIEVSGAALRTAHAVIGAALLAASVALALRIGRLPISRDSDLVATVSGNLNQLHTDLEYAAVGTDNSAPRTV
jgi:cytochrome c oxidase assembly protein subunit 15